MPEVRVPSFAKINLSLEVLHKRPDGYHELRTLFQTISLADVLEIGSEPARRTEVSLQSSIDIPDNIVLRAAHSVLGLLRRNARITIRLTKRIPLGGGLGGGSSNAAAVLLALPPLLGRPLDPAALLPLAAQLGSDVPFFLLGGTALGLGRGEELYPFPEPATSHGVLLFPGVSVSTPKAFEALGRTTDTAAARLAPCTWPLRPGAPLPAWGPLFHNDFQPAVFALYPEIAAARRRLQRAGAQPSQMTGSGAAVFGFFPTAAAARDAARKLHGVAFRTHSRAQYRRAWESALASLRPPL